MARRLNYKLFGIVTVAVVAAGTTVLVLQKVLAHAKDDPNVPLAQGTAALEKNQLSDAVDFFKKAAERNPNSPTPRLRLGEVYARMAADEPTYLTSAHIAWREAVQIDREHPDGRQALRFLVESLW
ncbi:MAG TPA: hypothetical protein VF796_28960, partial [Humisphaera sp.]